MPTRLQLARRDIVSFFEQMTHPVLRQRDLERMLAEHRNGWRLAQSMSFNEFLTYLLKTSKLRRLEFPFPHRKEVRYTWGSVPVEQVLLTLKPSCHFSHFTAVQLHDLTEQDPTTVYVNHEQPPKPPPDRGLVQERIDFAFSRKPRTTRNVARVKVGKSNAMNVYLLHGKHTGYLGVEDRDIRLRGTKQPIKLRLTDLERTLIDIAVRPFYAGGVAEVLKAYRRAANLASVNRIAGILRKLAYVYPYHQAIGFYLQQAGYDPKAVELFHAGFEYEFDFYLSYAMKDTEYVPRWRIYVPRGLNAGALSASGKARRRNRSTHQTP